MQKYAHVCKKKLRVSTEANKTSQKNAEQYMNGAHKTQKGQRVSACAHSDASANFHKYVQIQQNM